MQDTGNHNFHYALDSTPGVPPSRANSVASTIPDSNIDEPRTVDLPDPSGNPYSQLLQNFTDIIPDEGTEYRNGKILGSSEEGEVLGVEETYESRQKTAAPSSSSSEYHSSLDPTEANSDNASQAKTQRVHTDHKEDITNLQRRTDVPTMTVSVSTPTSDEINDMPPGGLLAIPDSQNSDFPTKHTLELDSDIGSDSDLDTVPFEASDSPRTIFQVLPVEAFVSGTQTPSRERLEWHSMLATVLMGEVLNQEKTRLQEGRGGVERKLFLEEGWIELSARVEGRSTGSQTRVITERRRGAKGVVEDVIEFRVSEGDSDGSHDWTAAEQIGDLLERVDKIRCSWPTGQDLAKDVPRVESAEFTRMESALVAWVNVGSAVEFQVGVLRELVNEEIDVSKAVDEIESKEEPFSESSETRALTSGLPSGLSTGSVTGSTSLGQSFLERVLTDATLSGLWNPPHHGLILRIDGLVIKAKDALVKYGLLFEERHFPSFVEDVQTLINFPSRLLKTLMEFRIRHARTDLQDPSGEDIANIEKTMREFHHLLKLAAEVKENYVNIVRPMDEWRLPDCIEEGYDLTFLDGLRFYFTMLNLRLSVNKSPEKETDILDEEWAGNAMLGKYVDYGAVEIALQFCILTQKSVRRLTGFFVKEIGGPKPEASRDEGREVRGGRRAEMQKHFKWLLDGVRARQRKLLRFSRVLEQRLQNATEYVIGDNDEAYDEVDEDASDEEKDENTKSKDGQAAARPYEGRNIEWILRVLIETGHALVEFEDNDEAEPDTIVIASPELQDQPKKIATVLGLVFRTGRSPDGPTYILALRFPSLISNTIDTLWHGNRVSVACLKPLLQLPPFRLRLIANGMELVLGKARTDFGAILHLRVAVPQRPNIPTVDSELGKIKRRIADLSQMIVRSVGLIRKQTSGVPGGDELIHRSFQFASDFGERSLPRMRKDKRALASERLMMLALEWLGFVCKDCDPSIGRTFRWAVTALEFAARMMCAHLLQLSEEAYGTIQRQVAQCMSLLVSHFDIMGARSFEQRRRLASDERENPEQRVKDRLAKLAELDARVRSGGLLGRVLDPNNEADRALALLSSAGGHIGIRWQQGAFLGGGTFGTVFAAQDLDSGQLLAVKEIRLPDPLLIPFAIGQIRDEVRTLQRLRHPYIVQYFGIEPHRDKICIFMEYCPGGSLAGLLQYGPIEDEVVVQLYTHMMLEGLTYLHGQGVAHRDLKPQNILLTEDGSIKFVDFGTAKSIARTAADLASKGEEGVIDRRLMSTIDTLDVEGLMALAPEVVYAAFSAQDKERKEKEAADAVATGGVVAESEEFGEEGEYDFGHGENANGGGNTQESSALQGLSGLSGLGKDILTLVLGAVAPELAGTAPYLPPEAVTRRGFPKRTAPETPSDDVPDGSDRAQGSNPAASSPGYVAGEGSSRNGTQNSADSSPPTAGDIWSLGCVIVEMCTGERPWIELDNEWAILYSISRGLTPIYPSADRLSFLGQDFLGLCFEPDPRKRSSAVELLMHKWIREVVDEPEVRVNDGEQDENASAVLPPYAQTSETTDIADSGTRTPIRPASAPPSALPSPSSRNAEIVETRQSPEFSKRSVSAPTSPRVMVIEAALSPSIPVVEDEVVPVLSFEGDSVTESVQEFLNHGADGGGLEPDFPVALRDGYQSSSLLQPIMSLGEGPAKGASNPGSLRPDTTQNSATTLKSTPKGATSAYHTIMPGYTGKSKRDRSFRSEKDKDRSFTNVGMKRSHSAAVRAPPHPILHSHSHSHTPGGTNSAIPAPRPSFALTGTRIERDKVDRKRQGDREKSVKTDPPTGNSGFYVSRSERPNQSDMKRDKEKDVKEKDNKTLRPRTMNAMNSTSSGLPVTKVREREKDRRRSGRHGMGSEPNSNLNPRSAIDPGGEGSSSAQIRGQRLSRPSLTLNEMSAIPGSTSGVSVYGPPPPTSLSGPMTSGMTSTIQVPMSAQMQMQYSQYYPVPVQYVYPPIMQSPHVPHLGSLAPPHSTPSPTMGPQHVYPAGQHQGFPSPNFHPPPYMNPYLLPGMIPMPMQMPMSVPISHHPHPTSSSGMTALTAVDMSMHSGAMSGIIPGMTMPMPIHYPMGEGLVEAEYQYEYPVPVPARIEPLITETFDLENENPIIEGSSHMTTTSLIQPSAPMQSRSESRGNSKLSVRGKANH